MTRMIKAIATGAAAVALSSAALPQIAAAQVQAPGFFGSIEGMYIFDPSGGMREAGDSGPGFFSYKKVSPGDGFGGDGKLGYRFMGGFDIAFGGGYHEFSKGKVGDSNNSAAFNGWRIKDADLWTVDGEIGYTFNGPGWGLRPAIGARYIDFSQKGESLSPPGPQRDLKQSTHGFGPQLGLDGAVRLSGSISLVGGIDGAVLFGKTKTTVESGPGAGKTKDSRTIWQFGGNVGLDWEVARQVHIVAGYKVNYSDGLFHRDGQKNAPGDNESTGRGDLLEHGPFIRLAYNIGAPPAAMPVVAAPPPPPPPAPKKNYLVFFDFDRSNITADAQRVIEEAAAAAKAGGSTRLQLTGHTDRSGSDQYNMALSLRRGEAVKQALIRLGIPAASIAVIGRGESQPLVPTADGVREPQNRRVEILL